MIAFKYRSNYIDSNGIYRDIESLKNNLFYAAPFKDLNDPFEGDINEDITTLINWMKQLTETTIVERALDNVLSVKDKVGIYSLSKGENDHPLNNLMWSHYANNHKEFCIGYDTELLMKKHQAPNNVYLASIIYSKSMPTLSWLDIKKVQDIFLQKILATKSVDWGYENEVRLIFDDFGLKPYPKQALKSIYFGVGMDDKMQEYIIDSLQDRDGIFYKLKKDNYKLVCNIVAQNHKNYTTELHSLDYEILCTDHKPAVENFHIWYKGKNKEKEILEAFALRFREEFATIQANINLFDISMNRELINKYPMSNEEYKYYSNHLIAALIFDQNEIWMHPYN